MKTLIFTKSLVLLKSLEYWGLQVFMDKVWFPENQT